MITSHDGYHRYDARNAPAQHKRPLLCCESNGLAGAVRGFGAWTPPTDAAQAVGNTLPLTPPRTVPLPTFVFAICCRAPPLPPLPALPRTQTNPSPVECRQGYAAGVRQGEPCDGVEWGDDVVGGSGMASGVLCASSVHTHTSDGQSKVGKRMCAVGNARGGALSRTSKTAVVHCGAPCTLTQAAAQHHFSPSATASPIVTASAPAVSRIGSTPSNCACAISVPAALLSDYSCPCPTQHGSSHATTHGTSILTVLRAARLALAVGGAFIHCCRLHDPSFVGSAALNGE